MVFACPIGRVSALAQLLACAEHTAEPMPWAPTAQGDLFAEAVARHEPAVRRLVHRLLGWPKTSAEIDDIVQDVLLAAWTHRNQFRGDAQWHTWLLRIGINTTRNHQRRRRLLRSLFGARPAELDPVAPDAAPDLDARVARVQQAMADLAHADREVLVLRYLEQMLPKDIAAALRISRAAVDARLSRARGRLRRLLPEVPDA